MLSKFVYLKDNPKACQNFNKLIVSVLLKYRGSLFSIFWKVFQFINKAK